MRGELFYWLLNMSIMASVTGLIVMLLRLIKKIPRRFVMFLWLIPFFRMVCPVGINSSYGLMALVSKYSTRIVTVDIPVRHESEVQISSYNITQFAYSYEPFTYKENVLEKLFSTSQLIWLIVMLAILFALAIVYFTTWFELRKSEHLRENIYVSPKITSPAVYGLIRPRIIVPYFMKDSLSEHVLAHERCHIKRLDNLWRIIAFAVTALHWFNPFAWIFLRCFLSDMEIACDETVLSKLSQTGRKEYALALVSTAESRNVFVSAFGGANLRTRVEHILSYKRTTVFSAICFTALIAAIAYLLLTNAAG